MKRFTWNFELGLFIARFQWSIWVEINKSSQCGWATRFPRYLAQGRCCCARIGTHDLCHRIWLWIVETVHFWAGFPRQDLRTNKFFTQKHAILQFITVFHPFPRVCVLIFLGGGKTPTTYKKSRNDAPETTWPRVLKVEHPRRKAYRLVIHGWLSMIGWLMSFPWLVSYDWLAMSIYDWSFLIGYLWLVIDWLSMIAPTYLPCKQVH